MHSGGTSRHLLVTSPKRASELVLSPLLLASIVTLSGSHVFPGEIVAMRGLGSALAVAMMVAGRWDPTLAALRDTDWMCAPGGRLLIRISAASPPAQRTSCLR